MTELRADMPESARARAIRSLDGRSGAAYGEETFLHLLAIERARADRASQRLHLLLATIEPGGGKPISIPQASARRLFEALSLLLRETDIMGWYEQARVVGAVLSAPADSPGFEDPSLIEQRIEDGLRKKLPASLARDLRVRITQHGPRRVEKRRRADARD